MKNRHAGFVVAALLVTASAPAQIEDQGETRYFARSGQPVWHDDAAVRDCERATSENRTDRAERCEGARFAGPPKGTAAEVLEARHCPYEMAGIRIAAGPMSGREGCVNGDYLSPTR